MPSSPLQLQAAELLKLYEKKKLSPVEAVESCLKQILKYNPVLNAFSYLDEQSALHQAKASERRWQKGAQKGLLDGVPVTVKDSFNVKGWPTRQGSKTMAALPQPDDAPAVTFLRDQGAIILGKTTMP
jgi:aspartyl-tRNA(Asn)/glutamyl-tRNA(Gln) amidotransferase subunit A